MRRAGGRAGGNPVVWLNRLEGGREAGGMRLMTGGTERRVEAAEGEDRYTGQKEIYEKMRYMKKTNNSLLIYKPLSIMSRVLLLPCSNKGKLVKKKSTTMRRAIILEYTHKKRKLTSITQGTHFGLDTPRLQPEQQRANQERESHQIRRRRSSTPVKTN